MVEARWPQSFSLLSLSYSAPDQVPVWGPQQQRSGGTIKLEVLKLLQKYTLSAGRLAGWTARRWPNRKTDWRIFTLLHSARLLSDRVTDCEVVTGERWHKFYHHPAPSPGSWLAHTAADSVSRICGFCLDINERPCLSRHWAQSRPELGLMVMVSS